MKVGILAVQGDFEAHAAMLARMGVESVFVRTPSDMDGVDADNPARRRKHHAVEISSRGGPGQDVACACRSRRRDFRHMRRGHPAGPRSSQSRAAIAGTCRHHRHPQRLRTPARERSAARGHKPFAVPPSRWFSFALRSSNAPGQASKSSRHPEANPVLMRQGRILIATFHPELTSDTTVHEYFLR